MTGFRLPGYGGAAIFLRRHAVRDDEGGVRAAYDVGLLGPEGRTEYFARPAEADFPARLGEFLFAAASEFHPELAVPIFSDEELGFTLAAMSSTDDRVELQVTVLGELGADVPETDAMNFETSRAVLVSASHEASRL